MIIKGELNEEQGTSSWLTTLPIIDEGYNLTKKLFWVLIRIRYGWSFRRLQLVVNAEQGLIYNILFHAKMVVLFLYDTTKSEISLPDC